MRIYIETSTGWGEATKYPPTGVCQLVGIKKIFEGNHLRSEWYTETDDLNELIDKFSSHRDVTIEYCGDGSVTIVIN